MGKQAAKNINNLQNPEIRIQEKLKEAMIEKDKRQTRDKYSIQNESYE